MGKLRDISCWVIATALTVVLGALAAGCGKRVQEADGEQTDFEFEIANQDGADKSGTFR
jgi:hypothetical protein